MTAGAVRRQPLGAADGGSAARGALPRLTSLRALAALTVFAYHLGRWDVLPRNPMPIGYAGVSFFFVLSGFVLAWSTPVGVAFRPFVRRRLARIYPLHLLCLAVAAVAPVVPYDRSGGALVANLLLAQAWVPTEQVAFGFNGVSWSLSCELAFYLALPVALAALAPCSMRTRWLWAAAWFGVSGLVEVVLALTGGPVLLSYTGPALRFGEFLLGVVAAAALRRGTRVGARHAALALAWAVPLLLLLPFPGADVALTPLFLVVVLRAAQADVAGAPGGLLTHPWLVYAGEVSFAFYLVHELVLLNLPEVVELSGAVRAGATLVVAAAVAALAHHAVERPARSWLLRDRSRPATT